MLLAVGATLAIAVIGTHPSRGETLTVHFQALGLFAGTAPLFLLDGDSRTNVIFGDVFLERDVVVLGIFLRQLGKVPDAGVVFLGLDEHKGHFWPREGR